MALPLKDFDPIDPTTPVRDRHGMPEVPQPDLDPEEIPDVPGDGEDFDDFKIEIPDWLKGFSQEGYGAEWMRGNLQMGGGKLASEANVMQRQLAANPFLQGASGSGFAGKKMQALDVEKSKQLSSLQLGVESKNLQVQRSSLDRLRELERFNAQIERDFTNMSETERLDALRRKYAYEAALKQYRAQNPSGGAQLGAFGLQMLPLLL